jgi:NlpC/P60 family putative phage cell wall peptidase
MNEAEITRVVQAARACIGTPFHHQGRVSGIGLDCIGLVVHALKCAGLHIEDSTDYGRQPEGKRLEAALRAHGYTRVEDIQAGDILLFRIKREPQHVALAISSDTMVHAYAPAGRVVESGLGETWHRRLVSVFRYQ